VHILIGLVLIAALVAWFFHATRPPAGIAAQPGSAATASMAGISVAYISGGRLFCKTDHAPAQEISSPYIQQVVDRLERSKERNAWKQGTSFQVAAHGGVRDFEGAGAGIRFSSAILHKDRALLYFLTDDAIGGLFSFDLDTGVEQRLLHKQKLALSDLQLDASGSRIVATSAGPDGISNIATLDIEGNQFREMTAGDTLDAAPAWVAGEPDTIVYQSAGLARSPQGYVAATGHTTIQKLNMRTGSIQTVLESGTHDFLHPRIGADGVLHFIRRPYETANYSAGNILLDTLLFPFRLLRAVFHFLNFFSLMYSRKPLTGAAGPKVQADIKHIILKGRHIDAEKALRQENAINGVASLVPRSWELVARTQQGQETVLATNVASYDLLANGSIIYSNGRAMFKLGNGSQAGVLLQADLIGDIVGRAT
jgi:hypothetical protein